MSRSILKTTVRDPIDRERGRHRAGSKLDRPQRLLGPSSKGGNRRGGDDQLVRMVLEIFEGKVIDEPRSGPLLKQNELTSTWSRGSRGRPASASVALR